MDESVIKISNHERIERILRKICQAGVQVLIRNENGAGTVVKGRATALLLDGFQRGIRLSNISEKGYQFLGTIQQVQVEFILLSAKVTFNAAIAYREFGAIVVSIPAVLTSIERRKNARYNTSQSMMAYLRPSSWSPKNEDPTMPPVFSIYKDMANILIVSDVSLGGLSVATRYPGLYQVLKRGLIDDLSELVLPMQPATRVSIEVRWAKRVKEDMRSHEEKVRSVKTYKFGISFVNPSEDLQIQVQQFIQQLAKSEAI